VPKKGDLDEVSAAFRGDVRATIWLLLSGSGVPMLSHAIANARPIAVTTPRPTRSSERHRWSISPVTMARALAMIGVMSGATIMAPMTVAVESARTPPVAITTERTRSTANHTYGSRVPSASK
jgi:hypothetical protein